MVLYARPKDMQEPKVIIKVQASPEADAITTHIYGPYSPSAGLRSEGAISK